MWLLSGAIVRRNNNKKKILLTKMRKTKNSAHAAFSLKGGYPQGIIT